MSFRLWPLFLFENLPSFLKRHKSGDRQESEDQNPRLVGRGKECSENSSMILEKVQNCCIERKKLVWRISHCRFMFLLKKKGKNAAGHGSRLYDKHKSWKHKSSCQELNHNSQNLRLASFLYPYKILNLTISCDLYYVKLVVIQALKIF